MNFFVANFCYMYFLIICSSSKKGCKNQKINFKVFITRSQFHTFQIILCKRGLKLHKFVIKGTSINTRC